MSYREDQHLRTDAAEAGRTDLIEAMDRADAALERASIQARGAYRCYRELSATQESKAAQGKEIRRQIRAIGEATISELETKP